MRLTNISLCIVALLCVAQKSQAAWPNNYIYKGVVTVSHTNVPNSDLTNFPVLVSGAFPDFATLANGGKVTNANGYDIIFSSDPNGATRLNFEREAYSPNGQAIFWVQVPLLSHTADTSFYVFYGNAAVTTDQSTPAATWDANYLSVWHLDGNPAAPPPQLFDSTALDHRLTASGSWSASQSIPGQIGNAINSLPAYNYGFTSTNNATLSPSTQMTLEAWININYGGIPTIMEQFDAAGLGAGYILYMNGLSNSLRLKLTAGLNGGLPQRTFETIGGNVDDGHWHHVVATYLSGTSPIIYIDGKSVPIQAYVNGILTPSATTVYSGSIHSGGQFQMIPLPIVDYTYPYQGAIDEARISNVSRSADWVATEYSNQKNPSSFYSLTWGLTSGGSVGPPPTVSVTSPTSGSTVSGTISLAANASAASGKNIASVQFQLNGSGFGPLLTSPPYTAPLDTTTLSNGTYTVSALAIDSAGLTATATPVSFTVNNGASTTSALLTGNPFASLRNNYSGFVGMQFTTAAAPLTVTALGRWVAPGNGQTHKIKLVNAATALDVIGGSVSLSLAGATPGKYAYANLNSPVTLNPNAAYFLLTEEANGGDQWYDRGLVTASSAGTVFGPVYSTGTSYVVVSNIPSASYGPPNLLYQATAPPTVSISSPISGSTVSNTISLTATASAVSGRTITGVQFQLNGSNIGPLLAAAPYTTSLNTATLSNGTFTLTAIAQDSAGVSATSPPVQITVANSASAPGPFVTGQALTTLRNDYGGFVGMKFTVGGAPLTVTQLGRWKAAGNTQTHTVKLVNAATGVDVPGASVAVSLSGATAGQFAYATLTNPVILPPGASYYLLTQESAAGDQWYNYGPVTASPFATVNGPAYSSGSAILAPSNLSGSSYGPVNFQFSH